MARGIRELSALASMLVAVGGCRPLDPVTPRPVTRQSRIAASGQSPARSEDPAVTSGQALYADHCADCHGARGRGDPMGRANALGNQAFLRSATDAFLLAGIARGRPGTPMEAYAEDHGGPLAQADIEQLLTRLRRWQTEPAVDLSEVEIDGEATRGAKLYAGRCAGCHGVQGEGATAMSLNNPVFLQTASDGYIHYAIAEGRPGTPMPSYQTKLTTQQIDDMVALVRAWAPAPNADDR